MAAFFHALAQRMQSTISKVLFSKKVQGGPGFLPVPVLDAL